MKRKPNLKVATEGDGDITPALRVLVGEEDPFLSRSLTTFLRAEGHAPTPVANAEDALRALQAGEESADDEGGLQVAILSSTMPGGGAAFLREVLRRFRSVSVVVLAGYATVEAAVESLRVGACDYLVKPIVDAELRQSLARAARQHALQSENQALRRRLSDSMGLDAIVGSDPRMRKVYDMIHAVAPGRTTVLMEGESGTGKSLIAHAIHRHSPRRDKPYIEISCGSIPETLLESELFGHVKGAFTGAHADKVGRFVAAQGGTIFLDEINSASPGMQLKLLRVLQERRFEPVGSTVTVEVDTRVILASNQPLEDLVAGGQFRQDLYYRVNVLKIELPPLRDRPGDIPSLAARFLEKHAADLGRQIVGFDPDALELLRRYDYPGNVRELQNIIERAAVLTQGQTIAATDLPDQVRAPVRACVAPLSIAGRTGGDGGGADEPWIPMTLDEALRAPEKDIIVRALKSNNWNRQKTSDQLGVNRTTLYKKMKAHGLLADERLAG